MDTLVSCINGVLEQEAAREKEARGEGFAEGKAAAENEWFLRALKLESEIASHRTKACKADTMANLAIRERDAQKFEAEKALATAAEAEARAQKAEDRARELTEANEHLARTAAADAEAAVRSQVDQLEERTKAAEESARLAEAARDGAEERAALVGKQLELTEERVQALEAELRAREEKLVALGQEALRLSQKEGELTAEVSLLMEQLDRAEATAKEVEASLAKAESRPSTAMLGEAVPVPEGDAPRPQHPAEERADALSLQVEGLQRALEELKAKAEAEGREAELREVRSNVEYFNAAVQEIQEEFPELDLSKFYVPIL